MENASPAPLPAIAQNASYGRVDHFSLCGSSWKLASNPASGCTPRLHAEQTTHQLGIRLFNRTDIGNARIPQADPLRADNGEGSCRRQLDALYHGRKLRAWLAFEALLHALRQTLPRKVKRLCARSVLRYQRAKYFLIDIHTKLCWLRSCSLAYGSMAFFLDRSPTGRRGRSLSQYRQNDCA